MLASGDGLRKRQQLPGSPTSPATYSPHDPSYPKISLDEADNKDLKFAKHLAEGPQPFNPRDYIVPLILTLLSCFTRFYKISWANYVVWDEAHFGKFASHYLKHDFYSDVHPPLGKILLGFSAWVAGIDPTFGFESGANYPDTVNYVVMRVFCASFGAGMVPIAYFTGKQLKFSELGAVLLAVLTLTDIAFLAISRNYQKKAPFSFEWWLWMALTGFSLGTVLSVKWVGLFSIALVGLHTLEDLWEMLGDLKMPLTTYIWHWIARVICLILIPSAVYVFSFYLHFALLYKSGEGDAQMSSLFQANLEGNNFHENPLEIAYGSRVTFKNNGRGGGLLHSHIQRFPTGSEQQQVTCYHHKDSNNEWEIRRPWGTPEPPVNANGEQEIQFVKNGDVIRL
ncbi:Protein O-mannosyltransferase 2, partial [Nowakowskiella sp. JEL0407]